MTQNEIVEQAKQGNVKAIAALMNRLLKSQGMLATLERTGDRLDILIESDLRSPDDEIRIPKRPVLVGMLRKWFKTLEIQNISTVTIAWQKAGLDEPVWTEEIRLDDASFEDSDDITSGEMRSPQKMPLPPLPTFAPKTKESQTNTLPANADLDEMFGNNVAIGANSANFNEDFDFDDISVGETIPNIQLSATSQSRAKNDLQADRSLLLSDLPPSLPSTSSNLTDVEGNQLIDPQLQDSQAYSDIKTELPPRNIFTTANFQWQFLQYLVVCAIIMISFNLIHRVLGSIPSPKSTGTAPTSHLISQGDYFV